MFFVLSCFRDSLFPSAFIRVHLRLKIFLRVLCASVVKISYLSNSPAMTLIELSAATASEISAFLIISGYAP